MRNRSKTPKPRRLPIGEWLEPRRLLAANPTIIDLLVLYTTQAKTDEGGTAAIQADIQGVVDETNVAMQNSQIPVTIRLVHMQEITDYTGTGSVMQDELNMQGSGNNPSFHAEALSLRNTYGADLVDLVTSSGGSIEGGFSQQMTNLTPNDTLGYNAIDDTSLGGNNTTLAHEIGHNLGAAHDRGDPSAPPGPFDYAYGYRVEGTDGSFYDDIMSISQSSNDIRVPLYSNPNLTVDGVPFGVPVGQSNEADLAAVFPQTAPIVAAYRSTVVADTAAPTAGIYEMDPNGQTLTFTVRYRDDEAVNASTLASGNVYVSTPEGFNLSAQLLSVTGGTGNSFQKFATYRVTLPTANEPIASLKVMLNANQIKDINGNVTPASQLSWVGENPGEGLPTARNLGTPSPTVIAYDSIGGQDFYDYYEFTITSPQTVSAHLSALTADADILLYQDTNNDGILESNEEIATTYDPGASVRTLDENLTAGTYYLQVEYVNNAPTAYTLTLNTFSDTTPPTATLDTTDIKSTGVTDAQFAVTYTDNQEMSGENARYDAEVDFLVQLDNGFSFNSSTYPDSSNTDTYPQDAPSYRTTYSYFAESGGFTTNDNGLYTVIIPANTVKDAAGNYMPQTTIGSFRIAIGSGDTTPPMVASVSAAPVTIPESVPYTFTITYHDNVAVNASTLDNTDVKITGPNSFSQLATFNSVTPAQPVGSNRTATYQMTPPAGSWNYLDNGTYTLSLQSTQVKDTSGNSAPAGPIATFTVVCPLPGDANNDHTTNALDFNALATNYGKYGQGYSNGDFNYDGIVNSSDFALLAANYGKSSPLGSAPIAQNFYSATKIAVVDQGIAQAVLDPGTSLVGGLMGDTGLEPVTSRV